MEVCREREQNSNSAVVSGVLSAESDRIGWGEGARRVRWADAEERHDSLLNTYIHGGFIEKGSRADASHRAPALECAQDTRDFLHAVRKPHKQFLQWKGYPLAPRF